MRAAFCLGLTGALSAGSGTGCAEAEAWPPMERLDVDCSGHGTLEEWDAAASPTSPSRRAVASSKCICDTGYVGEQCELCDQGYDRVGGNCEPAATDLQVSGVVHGFTILKTVLEDVEVSVLGSPEIPVATTDSPTRSESANVA